MLTPAESALAARETGLPGLRLLLDPDALTRRVAGVSGRGTVQPLNLRYKPGTSAVLGLCIHTDNGPVHGSARCYAAATAAKFDKDLEQAPPGSILYSDPDTLFLVGTVAADRDLPGAAEVLDPGRAVRRLGLPSGPGRLTGPGRPSTTILRYNPHRRIVATLHRHGEPTLLLRVVPPAQQPAVHTRYRALGRLGAVAPALVADHQRYGLVAVEWLEGHTVETSLRRGVVPSRTLARIGAAIARVHASDLPMLPVDDAAGPAWHADEAASVVTRLLPDLEADVAAGVARTGDLPSHTGALRPLHGDLSADQIVLGGDGAVGLLDWDRACLGDPVTDLAATWSALLRDEAMGVLGPGTAREVMAGLADGYRRVLDPPDPELLATHTALHLLRRAVEPFRRRTPEWPDHVRRIVAASEHLVPDRSGALR